MNIDQQLKPTTVFLRTVAAALARLKHQLKQDYEKAYPGLGDIIHLVVDEEEAKAWELSFFPHLFLPDLVEEHIAKLGLQPVDTRHENLPLPHDFAEIQNTQPALALCG